MTIIIITLFWSKFFLISRIFILFIIIIIISFVFPPFFNVNESVLANLHQIHTYTHTWSNTSIMMMIINRSIDRWPSNSKVILLSGGVNVCVRVCFPNPSHLFGCSKWNRIELIFLNGLRYIIVWRHFRKKFFIR